MTAQTPSLENNWFAGFEPEPDEDDQRTQDEIAEDSRSREIAQDDEDGFDNYTGDDLPIVVRADGIIDVIENPCNITTEDAEFDRAMRSERECELRAAGVDMDRLAKLEGVYDTMLNQRGIHWGAGDVDSAAVRELTVAIDVTHAEIVKVRGY